MISYRAIKLIYEKKGEIFMKKFLKLFLPLVMALFLCSCNENTLECDHKFTEKETVQANCEKDGYVITLCEKCGE